MVTIRSSIASFERGAFQATGSRQLPCDDALLLAYILCTLICRIAIALHCDFSVSRP